MHRVDRQTQVGQKVTNDGRVGSHVWPYVALRDLSTCCVFLFKLNFNSHFVIWQDFAESVDRDSDRLAECGHLRLSARSRILRLLLVFRVGQVGHRRLGSVAATPFLTTSSAHRPRTKIYLLIFFPETATFLHLFGGFGITGGAHRLWAHRSYKAKWPLRLFAAVAQTIAVQVS